MPEGERAFVFARLPLAQIRRTAISACIAKGCWLKDLRGVSLAELEEQSQALEAMNVR